MKPTYVDLERMDDPGALTVRELDEVWLAAVMNYRLTHDVTFFAAQKAVLDAFDSRTGSGRRHDYLRYLVDLAETALPPRAAAPRLHAALEKSHTLLGPNGG